MRNKEVPITKPIYGVLSVGILIFTFVGFLFWLVSVNSDEIAKIESEGIVTEAYLIKKACHDHGAIIYEFVVDGSKFQKKGHGCFAGCANLQIGTPLKIKYLKEKPNLSLCNVYNGRQRSVSEYYLAIGLLSIVAIIALIKVSYKKNDYNA